ncbi:radical SAM family heme chaperone HemW [Catenovulum maritimum]|uniref:Heme chaperone HemW n=1 Tax=Catenovulum maritimum TaxID=1513271 RepID=A0A0J8GYE8_9ALTE|nr:radical SAM family heme chaperone HemW [Catenovulum maritimum]KMT65753.1 coproporphyrinogen III oxidase [Catenovulum maritimum]
MVLPPLSLYIHIPWCIEKCPYCDFNSHSIKSNIPESEYISCLLDDLSQDAHLAQNREIETIFFGGGTPSVFSAEGIKTIIDGVKHRLKLSENCEITLEANPGTFEIDKFTGFKSAGVNRFSIGVQSLQNEKLTSLGRVHQADEAIKAAKVASALKLNSFNLDLMHGLPDQSIEDALSDLSQAIALSPPHLSWYQLTIEENTLFASKPPTLPQDTTLWSIQEQGQKLLSEHGYEQYEISGYAKKGHQCQHNLNYWRFGDYLAIGCGAHGKITLADEDKIIRYEKIKHPKGYLDLTQNYTYKQHQVSQDDLPFEFFMNRFRLMEACPINEFEQYTGLSISTIEPAITRAKQLGFIEESVNNWQVTAKGHLYLNDLLELFV